MMRGRLILVAFLLLASTPVARGAQGPAGAEVIFFAGKGGQNCTAVWIAADRILTAGHCVGSRGDSIFWKANGSLEGGCVLARHSSKDVALIATAAVAPATVPLAPAGVPATKATIQIAGFSTGASWQGDTVVQASSTSIITVNSSIAPTADLPCYGDSGGPAYSSGQLVGIGHKIVSPFSCSTDAAEYTFVGNESTWVKGYAADSGCRNTLEQVKQFLSTPP